MAADVSLLERIRDEVRAAGTISFARFMELALYDPGGGYYSRREPGLGRRGDYFTASDVGHAFGRSMARQLVEIDRLLGEPSPFTVLEFGAGRGLLARDVLDAAPGLDADFSRRLRYVMVDRSPAMRAIAGEAVPEAEVLAPSELDRGHRGCVLAVELFDALPVHRVRYSSGLLQELRVGLDDRGALVEVCCPATEPLGDLAAARGIAAEEGAEAEFATGAGAELERMAATLDRGLLLIVDYGDRAAGLCARSRGTLLAYHRHATNEEYLERVGEQDLTAHVDFSALELQAASLGLETLGLTTQDRFLIANGILEIFEQDATEARPDAAGVKRRLQAMQLIHPEGMGRIFKVLALAKNCPGALGLRGLSDPFARDGS